MDSWWHITDSTSQKGELQRNSKEPPNTLGTVHHQLLPTILSAVVNLGCVIILGCSYCDLHMVSRGASGPTARWNLPRSRDRTTGGTWNTAGNRTGNRKSLWDRQRPVWWQGMWHGGELHRGHRGRRRHGRTGREGGGVGESRASEARERNNFTSNLVICQRSGDCRKTNQDGLVSFI